MIPAELPEVEPVEGEDEIAAYVHRFSEVEEEPDDARRL